MAPLLLLVVLLLSHIPASAPTLLPGDPKAGAISSSSKSLGSGPSASAPPKDSGDSKQKALEQEKKRQEQKELEAESKVYAKEHRLVSPTNGTGSYKGMSREFVEGHNAVRARYGVPPVKWEKKLARHARRWCNTMRKDCTLKHSVTRYGESIFQSQGNWNATAKDAVAWWGREEAIYDKATGNCTAGHTFKECGHFALMVGKRYQRIGCGRAECYRGGVFMSCNYFTYDLPEVN
ncbi:hypothetical protein BAE44_0008993 [Dichanthelium oligosanthes]|uniref:SCP domain-containing protein n=1 Tax=Dichanthelium oligosanthes TaxID=888268 RepID=A0A1E5VY19_9POAL|nr:hypothetical protein BAE44_0008993 [Dichanthelium oligosanthes]